MSVLPALVDGLPTAVNVIAVKLGPLLQKDVVMLTWQRSLKVK
jgi:hypothetical protein